MADKPKNKNMRNALIRVSAKNTLHIDNDKLHLKAGDIVEYNKEDILSILDDWCETKPFSYYLIEHNENADNIHFHIVIEFRNNSQCKFNTLKSKFPYGNIDSCRHGVHACVRYLTHADNSEKHQYSWDDVVTNNIGRLERYKQPSKYSEQRYINQIVEKILQGDIREFELTDKVDPLLCVKYNKTFDNAFKVRQKMVSRNPDRNITVYVLQGATRVGKSSFVKAYAEQLGMSLCLSSSSNDAWQDYRGQDIFCYDDFDFDRIAIEDLLKAIDPHNNTSTQRRYRNCTFLGSIIFIATNERIDNWYPEESTEHREALFRRINYVLNFTKFNGSTCTAYYTIHKFYPDELSRWDSVSENWKLRQIDDEDHSFNLGAYIKSKTVDEQKDEFLNNISKL